MPRVIVDMDDVVSVNEAAGQIGKGVATIWRWIKTDQIISIKLAGRTLIPKSEVERLKKVAATDQQQ
jgi:hypothetical protein